MSRSLSAVPLARRRQLSATLGLFAVLLIAIGAVASTAAGTALITTCIVVAFVAGLVLALIAWGLAVSVRADNDERRLDAAVQSVVEASGVSTCGCGHEHDPEELHVHDDPCAHDGAGAECSRSCDTCVLSRVQRTSANAVVAPAAGGGPATERRRPSPTPR